MVCFVYCASCTPPKLPGLSTSLRICQEACELSRRRRPRRNSRSRSFRPFEKLPQSTHRNRGTGRHETNSRRRRFTRGRRSQDDADIGGRGDRRKCLRLDPPRCPHRSLYSDRSSCAPYVLHASSFTSQEKSHRHTHPLGGGNSCENLFEAFFGSQETEVHENDLVGRDSEGNPYSVRYHVLPSLLLNEMQKQQRTDESQAGVIEEQRQVNAALLERAERLEVGALGTTR